MRIKSIVSILTLIFFLFSLVKAEDILIIAPEKPTAIYAGQTNELEILIKNNRNVEDTFYFSLWGDPTRWTTLDKYWVTLDAGETVSISLMIEPPRDAEKGTHILSFSVLSLNYNISASKDLYLDVVRGSDILIPEIRLGKQTLKPGETLTIQPVIVNLNKKVSMDVFITTEILKDGLIIEKFEESITVEPKTTKTLSFSFNVKNIHKPEDYEINVIVKDSLNKILDEKTTKFKVEAVHRIDKSKRTENSILYSTVTITITNKGNVVEKNFYVTESMPLISKNFFYPETEPFLQEEKENRVVYKWFIAELKPDEVVTIKYQLRFTNVVLVSSALIAIVVWATWLFYRPSIKKNYIGFLTKDREVTVSLNIKNKARKVLNNILVRDFVPAVASVVKKFDTLEPKIKKKSTGVELIWRIKQLKPKEERVLTYKIKPLLDIIGGLKLPKAYLMYETKKGKKKRILSRAITIKRKVK